MLLDGSGTSDGQGVARWAVSEARRLARTSVNVVLYVLRSLRFGGHA